MDTPVNLLLTFFRGDHHKQFCVSTYCKGLFDRDLKLCYKIFCAKDLFENEEYTDCILDNCGYHLGFMRKVCIYDKCRKNNGGTNGKTKTGESKENVRTMEKLMGEVWSGELSAPQSNIGDMDELWYPDFEKISDRPDLPEMAKSCTAKCKEKALNGEDDFEACFLANCKSVSGKVSKRWSTRMCMESHCKSANNKVQYFLCGKQHCHK